MDHQQQEIHSLRVLKTLALTLLYTLAFCGGIGYFQGERAFWPSLAIMVTTMSLAAHFLNTMNDPRVSHLGVEVAALILILWGLDPLVMAESTHHAKFCFMASSLLGTLAFLMEIATARKGYVRCRDRRIASEASRTRQDKDLPPVLRHERGTCSNCSDNCVSGCPCHCHPENSHL